MKKTGSIIAIGFALSLALGAGPSAASELNFKFNNPSFGGNPFIGQHLLNTANAINKHKEKIPPASAGSPVESNDAKEFEENLRRQVLNRLARRIVESAFGENGGLVPGTHVIGDNEIVVTDNGITIGVTITNIGTGSSTAIEVPHF